MKCKICNKLFEKEWLLKKHITQKHKETTVAQYIVDFEYDGNWPLCKCGCNKRLTYFPGKLGFSEYIRGHISKIKNNYNTEKSKNNSIKTRKKKFKTGEIIIWNKGITKDSDSKYAHILKEAGQKCTKKNNPERAAKISKAMKGVPKSREHVAAVVKTMNERYFNNFTRRSGLEIKFDDILKTLNISYDTHFILQGYTYDFHLPKYNILIETDGDFWHCNIDKGYKPKYQYQKDSMRTDKIKNHVAKENGYKLLRFWEYDIKNNRMDVIQQLITEIKNESTINRK
jgi:very-short-patch-repair endonuclease